jgi:hypothetical protein
MLLDLTGRLGQQTWPADLGSRLVRQTWPADLAGRLGRQTWPGRGTDLFFLMVRIQGEDQKKKN